MSNEAEARLDALIIKLDAQLDRINARYLDELERVASAGDKGSLAAALDALQDTARQSQTVGELAYHHKNQRKLREQAKENQEQLS